MTESPLECGPEPSEPFGLAIIDKPAGLTSHDVVNTLRRRFGTRRVGHTGTLDPMATGVLVVCIGAATRLAEYLPSEPKVYDAEMLLGIETDSEDTSGHTIAECDASHVALDDLVRAAAGFRGDIEQTPPMASAVRIAGVRLYKLARRGEVVARPSRPVRIFALDVTAFEAGGHPTAKLSVACSAGTYIRTLCADIGRALGVGAAMSSLRRTRVGPFGLEDAEHIETCTMLRSVEAALLSRPRGEVSDRVLAELTQGRPIDVGSAIWSREPCEGEPALVGGTEQGILAVVERQGATMRPRKVLKLR